MRRNGKLRPTDDRPGSLVDGLQSQLKEIIKEINPEDDSVLAVKLGALSKSLGSLRGLITYSEPLSWTNRATAVANHMQPIYGNVNWLIQEVNRYGRFLDNLACDVEAGSTEEQQDTINCLIQYRTSLTEIIELLKGIQRTVSSDTARNISSYVLAVQAKPDDPEVRAQISDAVYSLSVKVETIALILDAIIASGDSRIVTLAGELFDDLQIRIGKNVQLAARALTGNFHAIRDGTTRRPVPIFQK